MTTTWAERAGCRGMDTELFFPLGGAFGSTFAICSRCPVREDCLDEALADGLHGIWGGTTTAQRRLMRAPGRTHIDCTEETNLMDETNDVTEITEALLDGRTVKDVAQAYDRPRQQITALINSTEGWSLDPHTDTVAIGSSHDDETPAPEPAVDFRLEAKTIVAPTPANDVPDDQADDEDTPDLSNLELLLRRGEQSETAATRAAADKARAAVEDLRQRVKNEAAEKQIRDRIALLQTELAAEQERLKEIRPGKTTAQRPAGEGPTPKEVRAWAAEQGIECSPNGRVPQAIVDQYLAAKAGAR